MIACRHCGTVLPAGALFCGDCGRSTSAPPRAEPTAPRNRLFAAPHPVEHRGEQGSATESSVTSTESRLAAEPDVAPAAVAPPRFSVTEPVEPLPEELLRTSDLEPDDPIEQQLADEEHGGVRVGGGRPAPVSGSPTPPAATASAPRAPAPPILPVPETGRPDRNLEELEPTRVSADAGRAMWVLQFSTGESVLVTGTGLVGRNPAAEPGEYVDHLVALFDAGRSVSKTHLEFGHESGRFWVSDRFSTNGSVVRPPDGPPQRCAPGRRYLVSRGTRVDIGEQFFIVS